MSVTVTISFPDTAFELAEILTPQSDMEAELESLVPAGDGPIPLVLVSQGDLSAFERHLAAHPKVAAFQKLAPFEDRTLYSIEWEVIPDGVIHGLTTNGAQIIEAKGTGQGWRLALRFPSHEGLSAFQAHLQDANIPFTIERLNQGEESNQQRWAGVTDEQRDALLLAAECGYYDVPRRCSSGDLAAELGISDQAVSERLRRGMLSLIQNELQTTPS